MTQNLFLLRELVLRVHHVGAGRLDVAVDDHQLVVERANQSCGDVGALLEIRDFLAQVVRRGLEVAHLALQLRALEADARELVALCADSRSFLRASWDREKAEHRQAQERSRRRAERGGLFSAADSAGRSAGTRRALYRCARREPTRAAGAAENNCADPSLRSAQGGALRSG